MMNNCKQSDLIGIAITSFNYGHYIGEAVQSVINQTSPNWSLRVYDNGSTDNTFDVLAPYLKDERVELVIHNENLGARKNFEYTVHHADTKFFSTLQADDFLEDTFVEKALEQFKQHADCPFVFFNWHQYMDETKERIFHNRFPFDENRSGIVRISPYLSVCNFVPFHMVVFRTQMLQTEFEFLLKSPLRQVIEQYLLKLLEDKYGYGCYSGSFGGVWRRHAQQITAQNMDSGVADIEEPIERHWYATMAPNPDKLNVFMAILNFVIHCSHVKYFTAAKWILAGEGQNYIESFNISLDDKTEYFQKIALTVAVKYTTYSMIKLCSLDEVKNWLQFMGVSATKLGFNQVLNDVMLTEGEAFINQTEIAAVNQHFFPGDNNIAVIFYLQDLDSWKRQGPPLKKMAREFDLYIAIPEGKTELFTAPILALFENAYIYESPEEKGSGYAFLTIFQKIYTFSYKAIVKLQSTQTKLEKNIYQDLLTRCLENEGMISAVNKNPTLGIYSVIDTLQLMEASDEYLPSVKTLFPELEIANIEEKNILYTTSSMFWFRPEAFKFLADIDLTLFTDKQLNLADEAVLARVFAVSCYLSSYVNTDRLAKLNDAIYQQWLDDKRATYNARDIQPIPGNQSSASLIHLLLYIDENNFNLITDTLDSLGAQDYNHWHLSILSFLPCPNQLFNEIEHVDWITLEQKALTFADVLVASNVQSDWVGFLEAGDYLEHYTLSLFVENINKNSAWDVVYSDEDRINEEGFFHNPKIKPDFNLDLLYSDDYIGGLVLFKTTSIEKFKALSFLTPIISYELILHYFDCYGEPVFGHIEDVLLHRTDSIDELVLSQSSIRQHVLTEHFNRNNISAIIEPGYRPGSFYIKFPVKQTPLISIIIASKNELEFLSQCIDSIFARTSYENYEVIIVDYNSDDPELLSYLQQIQQQHSKLKLITERQASSYTEINNCVVEQVAGEYILLLNNDTVVLQDEWLQGMLSNLQRENVGAVGARLVTPHKKVEQAGLILGMGKEGIAGFAHNGLAMNEQGYMGRAMAMQQFSALPSACLMMEKQLYQQVSGMDEKQEKVLFADVDLCLKIKAEGYKIVWVPYVTMIHHGLRYYDNSQQNKQSALIEQGIDQVLAKWLPQLADDPAYNRNLSLKTTDFQIDRSLNVSWDADSKSKPKIYAFPPDSAGVGQYRVRGPVNTLMRAGLVDGAFANDVAELIVPTVSEIERMKPDVLFMQNGFLDFMLAPWKRYRKFNDVFMVSGQDDIVYMLPADHPQKGQWPTNLKRKVKENFQHSDRLIVANEALAEEFAQMTDEIVVVPNYLENWRWESLLIPEKNTAKKLRVGWAGGQQHGFDLQFILPVVEALHKEVEWVFMGMWMEEWRPFVKEVHSGVHFDSYPQKLAELNLDLAIAPLMHNKFNECKTNLRLLEYGILGWPIVCSDVLPYQNAPVTRVANNPQHWIKAIREKINEPQALRIEGEVLRKWVLDNYMLDDHIEQWYAALVP